MAYPGLWHTAQASNWALPLAASPLLADSIALEPAAKPTHKISTRNRFIVSSLSRGQANILHRAVDPRSASTRLYAAPNGILHVFRLMKAAATQANCLVGAASAIETTALSKMVMSCTRRLTSAPSSTVTSCSTQSESGVLRKYMQIASGTCSDR